MGSKQEGIAGGVRVACWSGWGCGREEILACCGMNYRDIARIDGLILMVTFF